MNGFKLSLLFGFIFNASFVGAEVSLDTAKQFIANSYTPTFDCPKDELLGEIEQYLALEGLSKQQTLKLTSMRTHSLICRGEIKDAQAILQKLLADEQAERKAHYYQSALFQYGFVYDMQANPERCNYYQVARDSSANRFPDVHLSASLGYITECMRKQLDQQLSKIYETMQIVAKMDDPAALAHAYNRVGQFYATRSQMRLASNQYIAAIEAAEDIYTPGNLLAIMGNAISTLLVSQQFDRAEAMLQRYEELNKVVNTRRSNFVQYYYQSRLAVSLGDIQALENALEKWTALGDAKKNVSDYAYYRWYQAELCYLKRDLQCLKEYDEHVKNADSAMLKVLYSAENYLSLRVRTSIMLGEHEDALTHFKQYVKRSERRVEVLEEGTESMDVATLYMNINSLRTELNDQRSQRNSIMIAIIIMLLLITFGLAWVLRRKHLERQSIDSATGLYNNNAVINKLKQLPAPDSKKTNALAIFDIANFSEMNLSLGSDKSDFVLKQIADTFKKITRDSDVLGRLGPEQFVLCLANIEEDAAQAFFERTKEALGSSFAGMNNQQSISVDSSMSIYYSTDAFDDINEILNNMLTSLSMKAAKA